MAQAGNLTKHRLHVLGGPDEKTIARLLDGQWSDRGDVLQKLVEALNVALRETHGRPVTVDDIPRT